MVMQDARPLIECRYTGSEVCKSKDENNDTAKYGHARAYVTAITAIMTDISKTKRVAPDMG